jgi:hypothetical protein
VPYSHGERKAAPPPRAPNTSSPGRILDHGGCPDVSSPRRAFSRLPDVHGPFAAASDQPDLEHRLQRYNGDGPANALLEHRHHGGHHKAASDSWAPDLGPSPIDVQRYDLSLFLDFDRQVASGSIEVQLSAAVPDLQVVEFDASQILRILGVVLLAEDGLPYDTPLPLTHRHRNDRLSVDLPRPLVEGAGIRLMITYTGRASEQGQGINWHTHGGGARVAWTMAEPFGARLWWPCNDRP